MIILGVLMPRHSPLMMSESELQEQSRADDVDEKERGDPLDWEK